MWTVNDELPCLAKKWSSFHSLKFCRITPAMRSSAFLPGPQCGVGVPLKMLRCPPEAPGSISCATLDNFKWWTSQTFLIWGA